MTGKSIELTNCALKLWLAPWAAITENLIYANLNLHVLHWKQLCVIYFQLFSTILFTFSTYRSSWSVSNLTFIDFHWDFQSEIFFLLEKNSNHCSTSTEQDWAPSEQRGAPFWMELNLMGHEQIFSSYFAAVPIYFSIKEMFDRNCEKYNLTLINNC